MKTHNLAALFTFLISQNLSSYTSSVYSDRLWSLEGGERRILFYSQKVLKIIMIVRIEMMKFTGSRRTYL